MELCLHVLDRFVSTLLLLLVLLRFLSFILYKDFLADRTNGRAIATLLRLSSVVVSL